ncbi:hypothetical protein [Roseinatronobacter sp.]|uniref:hypothetical protein n=1 Tax=Roseinatronobacter sp. TaxID=1945755 RepID=UPI0025F3A71C|nr:hypothetical protein [Roseibaca sp.]
MHENNKAIEPKHYDQTWPNCGAGADRIVVPGSVYLKLIDGEDYVAKGYGFELQDDLFTCEECRHEWRVD